MNTEIITTVETYVLSHPNGKDSAQFNKNNNYLTSIISKLPKIDISYKYDDNRQAEYPPINWECAQNMVGYDYYGNRLVFILGNNAFFQRYTDSTVIMNGNNNQSGYVFINWNCGMINHYFLEKLDAKLTKTNATKITLVDIEHMKSNNHNFLNELDSLVKKSGSNPIIITDIEKLKRSVRNSVLNSKH